MEDTPPLDRRARDWVAEELDLEHDAKLSLFETVIRAVGGLLSAYDATADAVFLARAEALAAKCMPNFLGTGPQLPAPLACTMDPGVFGNLRTRGMGVVASAHS